MTVTPANMLGVQGVKGCLEPGADADLVVFSEVLETVGDGSRSPGTITTKLVVDEVWKFGTKVFSRFEEVELF